MPLPIVFGLLSAILWGAGDFYGGLAVRRSNLYGVVLIAHGISLGLLLGLALAIGEPVSPLGDWLWGGAAGICGAVGLVLLYRALATGQMSVAAPLSALLAAALPVAVGFLTEGWVGGWTLAGFVLALAAVWLISGGAGVVLDRQALVLPFLAGLSFGGFFVLIHFASGVSVVWPLVAVRIVSVLGLLAFSWLTRQQWWLASESWLPILLSSILDSAGNTFYALSAQTGRMDVAAVLGSLYPGSTVLLAYVLLKERLSYQQMSGIATALTAIVLISV